MAGVSSASVTLPTPLRWAVRLLWTEVAAVAVVVLFLLYQDFTATATRFTDALALTGLSPSPARCWPVWRWRCPTQGTGAGAGDRAATHRGDDGIPADHQRAVLAGVPTGLLGVLVTSLLVAPPPRRRSIEG